jgi:hypothetical protein
MCGEDWGGRVTSPSSSFEEEEDCVGVSSPHSFTTRRAALRAFSFCFHARIVSLWVWFAACLDMSLANLASHGTLQAPPSPYTRS